MFGAEWASQVARSPCFPTEPRMWRFSLSHPKIANQLGSGSKIDVYLPGRGFGAVRVFTSVTFRGRRFLRAFVWNVRVAATNAPHLSARARKSPKAPPLDGRVGPVFSLPPSPLRRLFHLVLLRSIFSLVYVHSLLSPIQLNRLFCLIQLILFRLLRLFLSTSYPTLGRLGVSTRKSKGATGGCDANPDSFSPRATAVCLSLSGGAIFVENGLRGLAYEAK